MEHVDLLGAFKSPVENLQDDDNRISSGNNLSDVLDVLQRDMSYNPGIVGNGGSAGGGGAADMDLEPNQPNAAAFNNNNNKSPGQPEPQANLAHQQAAPNKPNRANAPYVKIVEQPTGKPVRFRYECEGRSAGSIPGVNSTSENKTFPTIEIVNYVGRAVVVVSCVTTDPPYRPHPHNLVGKEGCRKGVCTVELNSDTMRAVFSNLGIQCVKKKDIDSALKIREEIRVDPFKTGFSHRQQPASIDLNSVRLCFQVFLQREGSRNPVPLAPVISDPIYERRANPNLVISTLCSCTCSVAGGKEIILLCERVAREDISIRFFEEENGQVVWEAFGDFQHSDVHKQTAIKFKTPRYRTVEVDHPVKVFIQLRRPSDGSTSEPLPFDYTPLDSGRRTYWALRHYLKRKPDLDIFQQVLSEDESARLSTNGDVEDATAVQEQEQCELITVEPPTPTSPTTDIMDDEVQIVIECVDEDEAKRSSELEVDCIVDEKVKEMEMEIELSAQAEIEPRPLSAKDKITEWMKSSEFERTDSLTGSAMDTGVSTLTADEDKTLNDLLEQVAELDEIYSDHILRRDTIQNTIANEMGNYERNIPKIGNMDVEESFDDAATYTSLQIAFKNPMPMKDLMPPTPPSSLQAPEDTHYDPVEIIVNPPAPVIDVNATLKREKKVEEEKLPPLPPKRVKKQEVVETPRPTSSNFATLDRKSSMRSNLSRPPSQIIIMKTPDQSPPTKRLPPTPSSTLPKQKKQGFFSKLFSRRKSKSDLSADNLHVHTTSPTDSREPSIGHFSLNDGNRSSFKSLKSLQPVATTLPGKGKAKPMKGKPCGRSVSSVSGKRPHLTADVVHIPLKGDSINSLPVHEAYSNASTLTLNPQLDRKTVSALQLAEIPINDGNMELVAIADAQSLKNLCEGQFNVRLDPGVDLTEAEHFALYTSIPPQATASEFDENSCYYAPVDAGEILTPEEVAMRLAEANQINL